jgi:hypothetical protein
MPRKWPPYTEPKPETAAKDESIMRSRVMADADACNELLRLLARCHPEHERPAGRSKPLPDEPVRKTEERPPWPG